jgi:F0F1-type ATP synthase epsilon subunit
MKLTLEIVTPRGVAYAADGVDRIVIRRREEDFVPGSEIAIYPHHAPLLMQTQRSTMRVTRAGETLERDVDAGVLEVLNDDVTLVLT